MELRRFQEELEEKILGEYAAKSSRTRGRERPEEKCDIRTDFPARPETVSSIVNPSAA